VSRNIIDWEITVHERTGRAGLAPERSQLPEVTDNLLPTLSCPTPPVSERHFSKYSRNGCASQNIMGGKIERREFSLTKSKIQGCSPRHPICIRPVLVRKALRRLELSASLSENCHRESLQLNPSCRSGSGSPDDRRSSRRKRG